MTMTDQAVSRDELSERIGQLLVARQWRLISAESCTGGLLAARVTEIPGSSDWFEGAFVTYRLSAKTDMIGVPIQTLDRHGAVSEPTARSMAEGALNASSADIAVAITGIAGPDGGDVIAPIGTVWFAWAVRADEVRCVQTAEHHLAGSRQAVRDRAVEVALSGVAELLQNPAPTLT